MTLYEMSDAARQLYDLLEAGEIDEQVVLDTMENIGASEKLESYVYVQKQLEAEKDAYENEIKRMSDRVLGLKAHIDRLKSAQVEFMRATGQKSANAGLFKITMRENKSCEIVDETVIPMQYMVEVPATLRPDKKAMLAALKNGEYISGAELHIGYSVTVK